MSPSLEADDLARWSVIASKAYAAYGVATGGLNFRGEPMPLFDDLPREIREAWAAAAREVLRCFQSMMPGPGRE